MYTHTYMYVLIYTQIHTCTCIHMPTTDVDIIYIYTYMSTDTYRQHGTTQDYIQNSIPTPMRRQKLCFIQQNCRFEMSPEPSMRARTQIRWPKYSKLFVHIYDVYTYIYKYTDGVTSPLAKGRVRS